MTTPKVATPKKRSGLHLRDLLLLLPPLALLFPQVYARHDPTLFGLPFFYWYQFAWVPLGALLTMVVFLLLRRGVGRR
jgi:hypothetical protein